MHFVLCDLEIPYLISYLLRRHDRYSIFAEEVTDKEAPGYSEVVKFPMDFGTMRAKVKNGEYGTGSEAAAALYKDFRQVFDNCYLYNDEGNEVTEEAIRVLGYLPETYVAACIHVAQQQK
jgi:Bromodomain